MSNTIPSILRKKSVETLFSTPTMQNVWPIWKVKIHEILGSNYNEIDIINLGDSLSEIFFSTRTSGRDQGQLSAGGVAWESLVCWYINLCSIGSRTVAFRKMSLVPKAIQDAITVNYGNFACNTESDITVVVFPNSRDYDTDIESIISHADIENFNDITDLSPTVINQLASRDFDQIEIGVIQCKTNWNDNAQIPMLWDMIYSANGFSDRNITIGREGFNIQDAQNFTYSFVTVPSNTRANYNSNSVAVKRVAGLSGGNYWGRATDASVSRSLKEIFTNNFQSGYATNVRADIRSGIPFLQTDLSYFSLI